MAPSAATYTVFGSVGCTTIRPIAWVFSRPIGFQVSPPSVLLKIPLPGESELRELGSPVPAQTWLVSDGAIASIPIETTPSVPFPPKTRRKVVPALTVFQMPPAALATKKGRDGLGRPGMSLIRPPMLAPPPRRGKRRGQAGLGTRVMRLTRPPWLAGQTFPQQKPAISAESTLEVGTW